MYQEYWSLQQTPFSSTMDPRSFYENPSQEESLARLHHLVDHSQRLGLLLGPCGTGKSILLEVFAAQLRRQGRQPALMSLLGVDSQEMLWSLAGRLDLNPYPQEPMISLWRKLMDRLVENRYQQINTILLLDDADLAKPEILVQVIRLAQSDPKAESRLTIILAANVNRFQRLGPRLLDLCELRIDLPLWEEQDTQEFLHASMARCGRSQEVFDPQAVKLLHQLSGGVPRRVKQLAHLSLVAGAGQELQQIDGHTIQAVHQELAPQFA